MATLSVVTLVLLYFSQNHTWVMGTHAVITYIKGRGGYAITCISYTACQSDKVGIKCPTPL